MKDDKAYLHYIFCPECKRTTNVRGANIAMNPEDFLMLYLCVYCRGRGNFETLTNLEIYDANGYYAKTFENVTAYMAYNAMCSKKSLEITTNA